jgi:hypothetical protein
VQSVLRLKLGPGTPANVRPLVIKLREGAEPVRMSDRKYEPPQLKFMSDKLTVARANLFVTVVSTIPVVC